MEKVYQRLEVKRALTLRTLDGTGKELWKREIRRAELGFASSSGPAL